MQEAPSKRPATVPRHPSKLVGAKINDIFLDEEGKPQVGSPPHPVLPARHDNRTGSAPIWH